MSVMSGLTEEFLLAHEAVEEIRLSKTYQKNLPLADNYADMYVNAVIAQKFFLKSKKGIAILSNIYYNNR